MLYKVLWVFLRRVKTQKTSYNRNCFVTLLFVLAKSHVKFQRTRGRSRRRILRYGKQQNKTKYVKMGYKTNSNGRAAATKGEKRQEGDKEQVKSIKKRGEEEYSCSYVRLSRFDI